jgi:hypothetical protein
LPHGRGIGDLMSYLDRVVKQYDRKTRKIRNYIPTAAECICAAVSNSRVPYKQQLKHISSNLRAPAHYRFIAGELLKKENTYLSGDDDIPEPQETMRTRQAREHLGPLFRTAETIKYRLYITYICDICGNLTQQRADTKSYDHKVCTKCLITT